MSRRRERPDAAADRPPVAVLPEQLHIYDSADWLPPDVVMPDSGSAAAWQVWEHAHQAAYEEFLAAGRSWHAAHELPPLRLDELPPDEPYTPPPNKVAAGAEHSAAAGFVEYQGDDPGPGGRSLARPLSTRRRSI